MNTRGTVAGARRKKLAAFSLTEAAVAMGIMGMVLGALYSGLAAGFFTIKMARENLRATQILVGRIDTLRLYSWHQITNTSPRFIGTNFVEYYDPLTTNSTVRYSGTLTVSSVDFAPYATNTMRLVTVRLDWKTGDLARSREFQTYVSRYGMQDYVY